MLKTVVLMGGVLKTAVLIDGGYLRANVGKHHEKEYNAELVEKFAHLCVREKSENLWRIFYYDAPAFKGRVLRNPISGEPIEFPEEGNLLLQNIAARELFAVREGIVAFRGWKLKSAQIKNLHKKDKLEAEHITPAFEQKGVDMRIGLDIATLSHKSIIERVVLVSGDTDMIPAMKHARKEGVQVVLIKFPKHSPHAKLLEHCDLVREVEIP